MQNKDIYNNYETKMEAAKDKTELAKDLGIQVPKDGYWGNMPSRVCGTVGGAIGGNIVRNAIESFEKSLVENSKTQK